MEQFLEVGKIVNTHGIRGELKVQPWCDSPEDFFRLSTIYIGQTPWPVTGARIHKNHVLLTLEGVDSIEAALPLKGQVALAEREALPLPPGRHFVADLIGLEVRDAATGSPVGVLEEVLNYPAQDLYVVKGSRTYLIPAVDAFVAECAPEKGYLSVRLLEGLAVDEN